MLLKAEGLGCVRGGRRIFTDVNFSLTAGEALAVTGANGAGKSSLLRILAGLLPAASGKVTLSGDSPNVAPDREVGEQTHYVGHRDALKPSLTVRENLSFWRSYLGGAGDAGPALEALGLSRIADLPAAFLSAGQRRRLSLARLVAVPRPVWLLDEPTTALDAAGQAALITLMQAHRDGGGIVVAATHGDIGLRAAQTLRIGA